MHPVMIPGNRRAPSSTAAEQSPPAHPTQCIVPATEDLLFQLFYVIKLSVVLAYITDKDSPQVLYRIEVWRIRRPWKNTNIVVKKPGVSIAGSVSASVIPAGRANPVAQIPPRTEVNQPQVWQQYRSEVIDPLTTTREDGPYQDIAPIP